MAVNLLTSSIFTVLTIVFLTWIFNLRQEQKWKKVQSAVYRQIGTALEHIFRSMMLHYENGLIDWHLLNRLKPESEKAFEEQLSILLKGEKKLDKEGLEIILQPELREREFLQFSYKLSEIESKYFQFLEPEIIESLIQIQQEFSHLENICNFAVVVPAFFTAIVDKGIIKKDQITENLNRVEIEPMVDSTFSTIIQEIGKLRKRGIPMYQQKAEKVKPETRKNKSTN